MSLTRRFCVRVHQHQMTHDLPPLTSHGSTALQPPEVLVLDVGNSKIAAALAYADGTVTQPAVMRTRGADARGLGVLISEVCGEKAPRGAIVASVVPDLVGVAQQQLARVTANVLTLDETLPVGMPLRYSTPSDIGPDRIANALAVREIYGGPSCAVDLGTATTFDVVGSDGAFVGGAISPGLATSADAMFATAARLKHPGWDVPSKAVGASSEECLKSGIILGYASLVDGLIERLENEAGPFVRVVATGGISGRILEVSARIDEFRPMLTLEGLAIAYRVAAANRVDAA